MGTPALNRALQAAVTAHQPPSARGRAVRLYYATQTGTAPPAFTIFTNTPGSIPPDYTRYLAKRFADAFGMVGVPVRITYRPRRAENAVARPRRAGTTARRRSPIQGKGSARGRRR